MKKEKYIIDLAKGKMSLEGYEFIVTLVRNLIFKYNWPKYILDENTDKEYSWSYDEVLSFTQQLLTFVIDKKKLRQYHKIPQNYIKYYFQTIVVSYAANKVKEHQRKIGLSYVETKRISIEVLNEDYFHQTIENDDLWNNENIFNNYVGENEEIIKTLLSLPKIPITDKTKHYKPRVKIAIKDIFDLINRPIKQSVLINQVFQLFDQKSFTAIQEDQSSVEIRDEIVADALKKVVGIIDQDDVPIYLDYFFSETKNSLGALSGKYNIPKSTIHYKIGLFRKIIKANYIPESEDEGVIFFEKLHKMLDELQ